MVKARRQRSHMGKQRSTRSRLSELVRAIDLHEHLCFIYETQRQRFSAAVPFVERGLERGEQCLFIAKERSDGSAFQRAMVARHTCADSALKKGQLAFVYRSDEE